MMLVISSKSLIASAVNLLFLKPYRLSMSTYFFIIKLYDNYGSGLYLWCLFLLIYIHASCVYMQLGKPFQEVTVDTQRWQILFLSCSFYPSITVYHLNIFLFCFKT